MNAAAPPPRPTTLSPFRHRLFLALWSSALCSHFGNAIQGVGASWWMTAAGESAERIALVQTAISAPLLVVSLIGGAVADLFDRRLVMLGAQLAMCAASVGLAFLSGFDLLTPWLLLGFTFFLGSCVALFGPAMQATIGDIMPRHEIGGAVSLNILGFNVARSMGPAIGGAIVAIGQSTAAFAVNAASYLGAIAIIGLWRPQPRDRPAGATRILAAIGEGIGHVTRSPELRTICVRAFAFTLTGGAAWALMPLVARDLVRGGPQQFGILLGALGLGAVLGALINARVRHHLGAEAIVRLSGAIYGLACLIVASGPGLWPTFIVLVIGGAGWVQALSGFMIAAQLWSPRGAIGRVASTNNAVVFGGLAIGAWLWGRVAEVFGTPLAIGSSGALMLLLPLIGLLLPMPAHHHEPG